MYCLHSAANNQSNPICVGVLEITGNVCPTSGSSRVAGRQAGTFQRVSAARVLGNKKRKMTLTVKITAICHQKIAPSLVAPGNKSSQKNAVERIWADQVVASSQRLCSNRIGYNVVQVFDVQNGSDQTQAEEEDEEDFCVASVYTVEEVVWVWRNVSPLAHTSEC